MANNSLTKQRQDSEHPREEIDLGSSLFELMLKMAEGNIGATRVLKELDASNHCETILFLDDMNIRGTQIWIGFKDYCGQDLGRFIEACKNRDPEMIELINDKGRLGHHPYRAVRQDAFRNRKHLVLTEAPTREKIEANMDATYEQVKGLLEEE